MEVSWVYLFVGIVLGFFVVFIMVIVMWLGVDFMLVVGIYFVVMVFMFGVMYEDGFVDIVDGFWGGWDFVCCLEIMKDSVIGVYGVIVLILSLIICWVVVWLLIDGGWWFFLLIVIEIFLCSVMFVFMYVLLNVCDIGFS